MHTKNLLSAFVVTFLSTTVILGCSNKETNNTTNNTHINESTTEEDKKKVEDFHKKYNK